MKIRDFTEVDLKIPMLPDMELAATKTAEAMGEYLSFDEDKIDEIKLALIEATINAFEHSDSDDRKVEITYIAENDTLTIKFMRKERVIIRKQYKNLIFKINLKVITKEDGVFL